MDLKLATVVDAHNPNAGDLYLENGSVRLTSSTDGLIEETMQRIRVSLLLFRGEWFLDETQGIPYWQSILGQKTPLSQLQRIFKSAVQQQPAVKTITRFVVTRQPNRAVRIDFACTLITGATLVSSDYAPLLVGA